VAQLAAAGVSVTGEVHRELENGIGDAPIGVAKSHQAGLTVVGRETRQISAAQSPTQSLIRAAGRSAAAARAAQEKEWTEAAAGCMPLAREFDG
jgi:hypothetical protein